MEAQSLNGKNDASSDTIPPPPPPGVEDWPTDGKLAAETGVSRRHIGRLVTRGKLTRYRAKDGTWRYDPDELAAVMGDDEAVQNETAATKVVLNSSSDVLSQALRLLTQAHHQIAKMHEPAQLALELLARENDRLSADNTALHTTHLELVRAREQALSEEHARRLAADTLRAQEARKDAIFEALSKAAPSLMKQLANARGGDHAASALLASFRRDQLQLLLSTDLLTAEQKTLLVGVLEQMPPEPDASPDDEPEPEPAP